MSCLIEELQNKDVISVENGCKIGYVTDVEAEVCSGRISAIIVSSVPSGFSLKRPDTFRVCWSDIVVMGDETILVKNTVKISVLSENPDLKTNIKTASDFITKPGAVFHSVVFPVLSVSPDD